VSWRRRQNLPHAQTGGGGHRRTSGEKGALVSSSRIAGWRAKRPLRRFPGQKYPDSTIHFLREKQRPGWRLYELTFQETDGELHRMISILQQNDDGSWRSGGGGTSSDMQHQWSKIVAPVRDHPLIFLGVQWANVGEQQYLLTAHGDVIDHGFHLERVRLVNEAGQMLEDVVEEGYAFFACKLEERVQLPMQAELYDRQGQLVWRQKIPNDGLPPWLKLRYQR
jgi:hypothetical protein